MNIIDVQYQLHDYYSTMRPQGQNVVQREVVRTVYISVYSIQETSSLIVQHIVDEAKPYHSTHTLFSFIVVPSRHDGLYTTRVVHSQLNKNQFHELNLQKNIDHMAVQRYPLLLEIIRLERLSK